MILKLGVLFLASSLTFLTGVWLLVQQTGVLIVDVRDLHEGQRIFVPIPMLVADVAVPLIPERTKMQIRRELGTDEELVRQISKELLKCPDGIFLEIRSGDGFVTVLKAGRNILINARTTDQTIHVQIPIAATGRVLARLTKS